MQSFKVKINHLSHGGSVEVVQKVNSAKVIQNKTGIETVIQSMACKKENVI